MKQVCAAILAGFAMASVSIGGAVRAADIDTSIQEVMIPGIWVDPDGCQHWVMDDGWEGFMTPNVTPDGKPVCGKPLTCAIAQTDLLFSTNDATLSDPARRGLLTFFRNARASAYRIAGHTDSRASDAYNIDLSLKRARAVADVAVTAGFKVAEIAAWGERSPIASNATAAGRASNRRVEIECLY